ncbi:MAG TPA: DNA-processing protein DprA [Hyphomicrobium sp.]|nr:DNA-processing protein DprA [Hyphomicrobium sp.]
MPAPEPPSLFTPPPPVAELSYSERLAALRLIRSENVGPVTFRDLISHFGTAEAALTAIPELSRRGGFKRAIRLCSADEAEAELARGAEAGAELLFMTEARYPAALAVLDAPPPLLYAKGRLALLNRPMVAVVGSRQCSAAGAKLARHFAVELGRAGYVVASGLARGIDSVAHAAALQHGTVAVLAGGIDVVYPPEHQELQSTIGERGCLLTEMPVGFQPRGKDFPRRNRIISGISLGVLIVEAARRSGTLVTARLAAEQGREVFAVPGHPLDPRAEGTNKLLKSGATLVTEASDLLSALTPLTARPALHLRDEPTLRGPAPRPADLSDSDRSRVVQALGPAPVDVDTLVRGTGLAPRAVQIALIELALAGRIERHGSGLVSLAPAP